MINIADMADRVYTQTGRDGGIAVILGSGLGDFTASLSDKKIVPYGDIPGYPRSHVAGHAGVFTSGTLDDIHVLAAQGRFHYYEGHNFSTIALPIQLFYQLDIHHVIITNAAGSTRKSNPPGTVMYLTGHMDGTFRHSAIRPRIFTGAPYYQSDIKARMEHIQNRYAIKSGVYCWTQGPAYETPAEVNLFRQWGADAVGMSTVPEIITAGELTMTTVAFSALTNYAAGVTTAKLHHEDVIETAHIIKDRFQHILADTTRLLASNID